MAQYIVTGRNQGYPRPPHVDEIPDAPNTVFTATFDSDTEAELIGSGLIAKYPLPHDVTVRGTAAAGQVPTATSATDATWQAGGGGGGGVPDDWITVYAFAQDQPMGTGGGSTFVFNTGDDPPAHGTAITWDVGTPDTVTINEDGRYDVSAKLVIANTDPGSPDVILLAEIQFNGDSTGPFYAFDAFDIPLVAAVPQFLYISVPGTPMTAGQTLQLLGQSANGGLRMLEGAMTVSRVA